MKEQNDKIFFKYTFNTFYINDKYQIQYGFSTDDGSTMRRAPCPK